MAGKKGAPRGNRNTTGKHNIFGSGPSATYGQAARTGAFGAGLVGLAVGGLPGMAAGTIGGAIGGLGGQALARGINKKVTGSPTKPAFKTNRRKR